MLREVVAEELVRIDDERLEFVTITTIDVDKELNRAIVYYDSLRGDEADAEVLEALASTACGCRRSIARQIRARKTPILEFRPDDVHPLRRAHRRHPAGHRIGRATRRRRRR